MPAPRALRLLLIAVLAMLGLAPASLVAQEATPVSGAPLSLVASGLTHPRGMTWGADGTLFVALAGSGGPNAATEEAPTTEAIGPWTGGPTGAVALIDESGCPVPVATGLPSAVDATGGTLGADDVAILGDQLYAAVDGGGAVHGNPDDPSGVYRLLEGGSYEVIADLSAWVRDNPVEEVPGDLDPDAAGYSIVADEDEDLLWVSNPNSGQILTVTPDGEIESVADLSAENVTPTKMSLDPEGGIYVGTLTTVPFPEGEARVLHVSLDGEVEEVWTGLTAVTDVVVGADGTLYAIELSTGNLEQPPFLVPGSGRIVRQAGPDALDVVAEGLMFPVALDLGPDGALYVAMPALGAANGEGGIMRLATGDDGATPIADAVPDTVAACEPIPETLSAPVGATPEASPVVDEAAADDDAEATPEASTGGDEAVAEATVTIVDFTFGPETLEIAAGTTVTFTNDDTTAHTATAEEGAFDTGNIDPGTSATVTFDTPGTYTYVCSYHPAMTGVIVVT